MLSSSCPRCHDSIRIPAFAKETSVIRCPRCTEEFPLSEIFSSLPPEAEIVSGPGSEVNIAAPAGLADTSEYNLVGASNEPTTDFQIRDSGPLASGPPMAKIDSSRPSRKPKKSEPNPILEFAKIIVGGAAGLAIAVVAIMWFGHQDVFKIVPKLPTQVYFLIPDELRTKEMKTLAAEGNSPTVPPSDSDVPVESIPTEGAPVDDASDADNQVSRNQPVDNPNESPLAAAFNEQVNASKQSTPEKKPAAKPNPKPEGRRVNAEMPVSKPAGAAEPKAEPKEPSVEPKKKPSAKPMQPTTEPEMTEEPAKAPQAKPTEPAAESKEPTPIDPVLVEMITEASEELGPIGAEIPPPAQAGQAEPVSEGNVDLSPVDDGDK
ncbi:hypothetical protein [Bremerella alba]|uniref:Uncharacterized protein n=1 Tax=Bremerella alba TaxID=980252 RepID=A0A7V9A6P5_9BACT|nr:hypothetical protein [Bremerella alba]MBA2114532.1 hypothetical protein [Bremerella alba]